MSLQHQLKYCNTQRNFLYGRPASSSCICCHQGYRTVKRVLRPSIKLSPTIGRKSTSMFMQESLLLAGLRWGEGNKCSNVIANEILEQKKMYIDPRAPSLKSNIIRNSESRVRLQHFLQGNICTMQDHWFKACLITNI